MKKCNKCKVDYTNDINFCKKCGSVLEEYESESEKKDREISQKKRAKKFNIFRYTFGIMIIILSIADFLGLKLYGLIGVLFGLSLLPIVQNKIFSLKNVQSNNFEKKFKTTIQICIPIVLGLLWVLCLPGEQLENITINDNGHIIAITENYEIDFDTNLAKTNKEDFEYISSNPEIAVVDKGIIIGKAEGNVIITIKGSNSIEKKAEYQVKYL